MSPIFLQRELNAEFQTIAKRGKKALLQWTMQRHRGKQYRLGKTRDLFKNTGDIKGTSKIVLVNLCGLCIILAAKGKKESETY